MNHPEKHGSDLKTSSDYFNAIQQACNFIKKSFNTDKFDIAIVLGSGHKSLAYTLDNHIVL